MPLIVTPGRLRQFSDFYHQLGAMLAAGLPLVQVLQSLRQAPPASHFRAPLDRILGDLAQGSTLTEALRGLGRWLPAFDLALLAAGEQSGRLDATARLLSTAYDERARLARQVLSDLAYPVFVLHAAVFLFGFPQFFVSGDGLGFCRQMAVVLVPIYALAFVILFAGQARRGERWRAFLEGALGWIPVLGRARRSLALARLAAALEALLNAGVPITQSWELAAEASGSSALRRAVASWPSRVGAGETPGELLRQSAAFPEFFTNFYQGGEVSGTLDENLRRLQQYYQDDATRKLRAVAEWTPRILYCILLVVLALKIIGFWVGYYNSVLSIE